MVQNANKSSQHKISYLRCVWGEIWGYGRGRYLESYEEKVRLVKFRDYLKGKEC